MVDGVIVAEDAERAAGRAQDEQRKVALLPLEAAFFAPEHDHRDRDCDQIAEQRFLCERQIAREAHERRHEREAERREHDIADGLALVGKHSFLLPFFLLRQRTAAFAFVLFYCITLSPLSKGILLGACRRRNAAPCCVRGNAFFTFIFPVFAFFYESAYICFSAINCEIHVLPPALRELDLH